MKNLFKLPELVILILILQFSGQAFGWRANDQYLDCTNEKKTHRVYAYNIGDSFSSFLEKYGTASAESAVKNVAYEDNKFLFILGATPYGDFVNLDGMLVIDRNIKKAGGVGFPVVFDSEKKAVAFCTALSEICIKTMGNDYRYVGGNRDFWGHKFTKINVLYRDEGPGQISRFHTCS